MDIKWFGHSCFQITDSIGRTVVTDPPDDSVGYTLPPIRADIVLVSHDHFDHNNVEAVLGSPIVIKHPGIYKAAGIDVKGVATYHDDAGGKLRGTNTVFCFTMDDIRLCHLGDLGHVLDDNEARMIGDVDVLLIPVGGTFTIDARGALAVIDKLKPKLVIPMHYRTPALAFDLDPVDKFIKAARGRKVLGPEKILHVSREDLDQQKIVLLEYVS
ncbi:MAG: MBL fold metallo-hydrolase [Methanothrix sp.]